MVFTRDPLLGWMPKVPCPWYCWQFWKWQKVRCMRCGAAFVSRDLGLMPEKYVTHFVLTHVTPPDNECR